MSLRAAEGMCPMAMICCGRKVPVARSESSRETVKLLLLLPPLVALLLLLSRLPSLSLALPLLLLLLAEPGWPDEGGVELRWWTELALLLRPMLRRLGIRKPRTTSSSESLRLILSAGAGVVGSDP